MRTYGQDSVVRMPAQSNGDDRKFLKQFGRQIMNMQFEAEGLPLDERDNVIIGNLKQMEADAG